MLAPVRLIQGLGKRGLKKARLPSDAGNQAAVRVACFAENVAVRRKRPNLSFGNRFPKRLQLTQAVLGRIAGDDGRIDSADGNARHPVRLDFGFMHGLIDTGLVSAKRATTLQNERNAIAAFGTPALGPRSGTRWMVGQDECVSRTWKYSNGKCAKNYPPLPKQVTIE